MIELPIWIFITLCIMAFPIALIAVVMVVFMILAIVVKTFQLITGKYNEVED